MGNHDYAAATGRTSGFNAQAAMASVWTQRQLSETSIEYLRRLDTQRWIQMEHARIYLTHGSPDDNLWEYVDPSTHFQLFDHYLQTLQVAVIAPGHTHISYVWCREKGVVFNPGSVGQPRNGDGRASFATLTVEDGKPAVNVRQVEYDIQKAATKIREAGLPGQLAERLSPAR